MNLMSAVFAPGRSTAERGAPVTGGTVVVVGATVVVVEAIDDEPLRVTQTLRWARFVQTCTWEPTLRITPTFVQEALAAGFSVAALRAEPTANEPEAITRPIAKIFPIAMRHRVAEPPALPTYALPHW